MNGEQWLVEAKKYRQGVKEATWAWLEHTSNWSEKDQILSATYKPFQAAINRYSDLSIRQQAIPITDPNVQPAAMLQARMAANFASVVDMRGQASDAYERVRHENNELTATIGKYFLDVVQERGEQIDKALDLGFDELLKFMKKYLPWILAGGAILIVLNVVSLVPKR